MNNYSEAIRVMAERFSKDSLISIATIENNRPFVRTVDGYYEDGAFYVVTYTLSNKMKQIKNNPEVAICGEWFSAHGIGENIGHVRDECNTEIMAKLREAFAMWYNNGHVDENDPNTCVLRIRLTKGLLIDLENQKRYDMDFENLTA